MEGNYSPLLFSPLLSSPLPSSLSKLPNRPLFRYLVGNHAYILMSSSIYLCMCLLWVFFFSLLLVPLRWLSSQILFRIPYEYFHYFQALLNLLYIWNYYMDYVWIWFCVDIWSIRRCFVAKNDQCFYILYGSFGLCIRT